MIPRQHIKVTARMYDMQRSAVLLLGTRYRTISALWQRVIRRVMEQQRLGAVQAALFIAEDQEYSLMSEIDTVAMISALVDLVEGCPPAGTSDEAIDRAYAC